jgi:hypothetical protein
VPTSLVQRKMHPALRARVRATLKRSASGGGERRMHAPVAVAVFRVITVLSVISLGTLLWYVRKKSQERLDERRTQIVAALTARVQPPLNADDTQTLSRVETILEKLSGAYEGDVVDDALKAPGALDAILSRPTIYVRGVTTELTDARRIGDAAEQSAKDAFLACTISPPTTRSEDPLLAHVKGALESVEVLTPNVATLRDAELGAPVLTGTWRARLDAASTMQTLANLRYELDHVPIEAAAKGMRARQLLVVMDEPAAGGGFTELEGDRLHDARVMLVDVTSGAALLRVRRPSDPSWISETRRRKYSLALDGCLLALDVRAAVAPK